MNRNSADTNGSSTKIGAEWKKSDFLAQNRYFRRKKKDSLLEVHHVLATPGKSCLKKKVAFAQIIINQNIILGDFLVYNPFLGEKPISAEC